MSESKTISFTHDRRGACSWILNLLWLVLGGWHMFLTWFVAGLLLCLSVVGIPCGWQVIKISVFLLFPFGKTIVYTGEGLGEDGRCCMSCCNCLLNVVWALTAGWILALQAFLTGIAFCVTIVGIPFGWQCFKLMYICCRPFGVDFSAEEETTLPVSSYQRYGRGSHMASPF
uniref:Inner membrane component domain-containing protein n=1 Tax=Odontella aurita TaxID=265563 RepID=A0A7S4MDN6_9STRA|mmetsp:Transcript_18530/g.53422  ORF Transcript_18530/g.53422 Transcript_18530/m.53422 type:complete len:172 (+) Transcript_18530:165-680(+)